MGIQAFRILVTAIQKRRMHFSSLCLVTKTGAHTQHHQRNSCRLYCCSPRFFKDIHTPCRLYLHRITSTVIPLHTHQSIEHQSSTDDVDCSCQRMKLLHKLDECFCARPSEVDAASPCQMDVARLHHVTLHLGGEKLMCAAPMTTHGREAVPRYLGLCWHSGMQVVGDSDAAHHDL